MCSTKYDFNIPELLCPKPLSWSLQGSHDSPLPLYQQTFRKIHYTK